MKVLRMCAGSTGLPNRSALVGSLRITRVTMTDASRGVKMLNDLPKKDLGFAGP